MKTIYPDDIPDGLDEYLDQMEKINESIQPVIQSQEEIQKVNEAMSSAVPRFHLESPTMDALKRIEESSIVSKLGRLAISNMLPDYGFRNPLIESIGKNTAFAAMGMYSAASLLGEHIQRNRELISGIAASMQALADSYSKAIASVVQSPVFQWLSDLDAFPFRSILDDLHIPDNGLYERYEELEETYYSTLMECKWFPYAAWAADLNLFAEVSDIMATSRGASQRREKRIDKAILAYYDKAEIRRIKRSWKASSMDGHIKKILGQAIEAHLRGEYALSISSLATMWEGLIYVKAHNATMQDRHRQNMSKTKKELAELTQSNDYHSIFSDYFDRFIVSQCNALEDVIDGVPNRHGASHSWYHKYPNKKASLNAILLTDFIINLEPIANGQDDCDNQE